MTYFDDHNISQDDDNGGQQQQQPQLTEQQLLELLAQEYGTSSILRQVTGSKPATSKSVLRELEVYFYDPEKSEKPSDDSCPICQEEYERGDSVLKLPCAHAMHQSCLKSWLTKNNSCPLCRHELMTDDPDSEREKLDREQPERERENISSMYM